MTRRPALAALLLAASGPAAAGVEPDYLRDVKPTLAARCYACHAALRQKAGLRVDTVKSLVESGAVVPGKSAESPLVLHVTATGDHARMPPPSEGDGLTAKQIELIRRWIDAGATAPANDPPDPDPRDHWAFRPPKRGQIPSTKSQIPTNPVDAFLATAWEEHGLTPQPQADKRLLLRRVTLDLTGLPPTPEEFDAFLKDTSPDAYEKVVDRLLASPAYGERWGRHFMDVWRYSDWWGLGAEVRNSQKHMWHWRDWIVESLNADKGYDQMVREMLAADELYPTDPDRLRATGYLARPYFLFNRTTWLDEAVEHTAKAFLGLTVNCAKCHDHKYDPIRQDDYYRLRAVFEPYQLRTDMVPGEPDFEKDGLPRAFDCNPDASTYKHERGDERRPLTDRRMEPGVPPLLEFAPFKPVPVSLPLEAYSPQLKPFVVEAHLAAARKEGEAAVRAVEARAEADRLRVYGFPGQFRPAARRAAAAERQAALVKAEAALTKAEWAAFTAPTAKRAELVKKRDAARTARDAARKAAADPGEAYTPLRGALKTPESNVEAEASRNKPFPATSTGRRTALANWIADKRNPLTARVLVNHVWARHFGKPLVATVFDSGRKGAKPTHPELLDWLACEFVDPTKPGDVRPRAWSLKHLHRLIVTSQAYRMSSSNAEADADRKLDPENVYLWRQNPVRMEAEAVRDGLLHLAGQLDPTPGGPPVPVAQQDASRRRSLYFVHSHNDHHKFLSQFDGPSVLECYRRTESIVPQQALALSNSKLALTAADAINRRLHDRLGTVSDEAFAVAAFEAILAGTPTDAEKAACLDALDEWRRVLKEQNRPEPTTRARANLVAALLNHNDFVTVR
jgi:hypothetical protein